MNVDLLNVKAGENTSTSQCDFRQTAANSSAVIGSQDCNRRVHFAATEVYLAGCDASDCSREDEILDSAEDAQSRPQIWYTEKDYEDFRSDRVATIRLFHSLQGEMDEVLEDFYCLRGLEPFHSPSLQSELSVHRAIYVNAVLSEQRRAILQKIRKQILPGDRDSEEGEGNWLADAIRHRIEHVSKWSMQRAQRLAVLDEIEARKINGRNIRRRSSWAPIQECKRRRCGGSPFLLQKGPDSKKSLEVTSQVNLLELKEMNQCLFEEMGANSLDQLQQSQVTKSALPETDVMSLNSLMQVSIVKARYEALFLPLTVGHLQQDLSAIDNAETKRNV